MIDEDLEQGFVEKRFGEVTLAVYSVKCWKPLDEGKAKRRIPNDDYRAHERAKKCLSDCVKCVQIHLAILQALNWLRLGLERNRR